METANMDSILGYVRKYIGAGTCPCPFDPDIIACINTYLASLTQLGVGPSTGFSITGDTETWSDFITDDRLEFAKMYLAIKSKLLFDPPASSSVMTALKESLAEIEWRLDINVKLIEREEGLE